MGWMERLHTALHVRRGAVPSPGVTSAVIRIEYARTPPAAWQDALDAQHIPGTARLVVAWEPGDVWQPIHRWFLWQYQPWGSVPPAVQAELTGAHPRASGHYCAPSYCDCKSSNGTPMHQQRWVGGPCRLIDRRTWELQAQHYAATGTHVWPRRLWVVQGESGGHPFTISASESKYRRESGQADDVPSAGALPYAPVDARVLTALERYDLFRFAAGLGDPLTNVAKATLARMSATERDAHRLMWAKWETLAEEWADGAAHAARKDGLHHHRWRPVGQRARDVDYAALREQYITDTDVEAVA